LGLLQGGFQACKLALRFTPLGGRLIEALLRAHLACGKLRCPSYFELGQRQCGLRFLDVRLDLDDRRLIGCLLDYEEQVALIDVLAFVEKALFQEAFDAGA
jgi:hypothetical protein